MVQPGKVVLIVGSIGDIHSPIYQYLEAKSGSRIDPGNAHAPADAIVKHGSFNAANL